MGSIRKRLGLALKLGVSVALTAYVVRKIGQQQDWGAFVDRLGSLSVPWVVLAFVAQLAAMTCTILRWKLLLEGQEMDVPLRHLVGSFMIGRFIGTFTPSTVGLDGYRMYDIAKHSGQVARSVSVILVEKVIGFFVLSVLVLATLPWGLGILPGPTLASVGVLYAVPVTLALLLLVKPSLIGRILGVFFRPGTAIGKRIEKATSAVTTYEAHRGKLVRAVAVGFPIHVFTIFIFICTGMAIGADVSVADMLFVGPLVITATVLPISLSGLGVREAAYMYLLSRTGIGIGDAALLSFLGYLVGRAISMFGIVVWLVRRRGYKVEITGRAMEEAAAEEAAGKAAPQAGPAPAFGGILRHLSIGAGAGLLAGVTAGLVEMTYVLCRVAPPRPWGSLGYAAAFYGVFCGLLGAGAGLAAWAGSRFLGERRPWLRPTVEGFYAAGALGLFCAIAAAVVRFRVFRDAFDERLPALSAGGLGVQAGILVVVAAIFAGGFLGLRRLLRTRRGGLLLRAWGTPALAAAVVALGFSAGLLSSPRTSGAAGRGSPTASGPSIVLVMIDTLRVDEVGAFNPERAGQTDAMDALAREGIVFRQAFAQASWTRPSVASVLTGRFPSAHGTTHKDDALPDEAPTIAELLRDRGYRTAGIVTNYNLAPDFNFQQGFDDYAYLEPERFLWADDTTAKLALYEIFRVVHERHLTGAHDVGRYYQDAERVTDEAIAWLDRSRSSGDGRPFFLFVQYMDPHDPYFPHDGSDDVFGHAFSPNPPKEKLERIMQLYRGEISYTDRHVGRLVEALRSRGMYEGTEIVLWSDHGEEFQDHGDWWHGTTLYDELVHVPLIVKPAAGGAAVPGTSVPGWVSLIDVSWTLLRRAGYEPADLGRLGYQGADLFVPRASPLVFMEEDHQGNVLRALRYVGTDGQAYKFIQAEAIARPGLRPEELYCETAADAAPDLTAAVVARRERDDQTAARPQVVAEGRARVTQPAEAARLAALPSRQVEPAGTDEERLRALGYIRDEPAPSPAAPPHVQQAVHQPPSTSHTLCAP